MASHLLDKDRSKLILRADDGTLAKSEKEASQARLAAERLVALIPLLQADLAAAQGRETLAALREEAVRADAAVADLRRWQLEELPAIQARIATGLRAEARANALRMAFLANVETAYEREEVRDAGKLGVTIALNTGHQPSQIFPNWR